MDAASSVTYLKTFGERLQRPYGITIDQANHIYVAEASGSRVTKFNQEGRQLMSFGRARVPCSRRWDTLTNQRQLQSMAAVTVM